MALLVLLLFFQLILDINSQYVPQPRLLVSPEVLTESGSVRLHCDVPHGVKVSQCYFYPERNDTNTKLSPSCRLSVTGSELIRWTGRSSPGTRHIICFYTVNNSGVNIPSPHSVPAPVTIRYQKPILSINHDNQFDEFRLVCEIPESESVRADFSCNLYTGENPQPYRTQTSQKTQSGKPVCIFTAQRNDLFRRLQSVKSGEVSCDYSLTSDPTARSLMSQKYNITHFSPKPTQSSSEQMWPPITTEDRATGSLLTILLVTGVCVLLVGLVSVCLCMCIRKKKTRRCKLNSRPCDQDVMMSMFAKNKPSSDAAESNLVSQPSDPRGDKKTLDNDIYDYNSIPDTRVTTKTGDAVYSLPQKY